MARASVAVGVKAMLVVLVQLDEGAITLLLSEHANVLLLKSSRPSKCPSSWLIERLIRSAVRVPQSGGSVITDEVVNTPELSELPRATCAQPDETVPDVKEIQSPPSPQGVVVREIDTPTLASRLLHACAASSAGWYRADMVLGTYIEIVPVGT